MKRKWNISVEGYDVTFNDLTEKELDIYEYIFSSLGINYKITSNILKVKNGKIKYFD